jgi:hypothetical protein
VTAAPLTEGLWIQLGFAQVAVSARARRSRKMVNRPYVFFDARHAAERPCKMEYPGVDAPMVWQVVVLAFLLASPD